jgi:hypothetical protein
MHDKSKKKSAPTLKNRTRDAILQRLLDGQGSVDDIHRLPFHLRDELLQLYNFQCGMNGLRDGMSIRKINEILQIDHASPLTMSRMYYTIPKSKRTEFIKLYWSSGYQWGDISNDKLYEILGVAEADRIAMDEALRLYREEMDNLVLLFVDVKAAKVREMNQLLQTYPDRDSIIQEAEVAIANFSVYVNEKMEIEMDRWGGNEGEANYYVNLLRPFGSLLTEAIFNAAVTDIFNAARSNITLLDVTQV